MAEAGTIRRTMLQKSDVPDSSYETMIGISELAPDGRVGRESHPGVETGYILEGSATLLVDGQAPLTLGAGQSWKLPARAVHDFRAGPAGVKALASWVVEKGKPFASAAR